MTPSVDAANDIVWLASQSSAGVLKVTTTVSKNIGRVIAYQINGEYYIQTLESMSFVVVKDIDAQRDPLS